MNPICMYIYIVCTGDGFINDIYIYIYTYIQFAQARDGFLNVIYMYIYIHFAQAGDGFLNADASHHASKQQVLFAFAGPPWFFF